MKKILLIAFLIIGITSCVTEDDLIVDSTEMSNEEELENMQDENEEENSFPSAFGMRFVRNGVQISLNNPVSGINNASTTNIFSAYPIEDYVLFQGRNGLLGNLEIDIWILREHLVSDTTYEVSSETDLMSTHIDMIDNSNDISENTVSGFIGITDVDDSDPSGLTVIRGTFEFNTSNTTTPDVIDFMVTEGEFEYILENE